MLGQFSRPPISLLIYLEFSSVFTGEDHGEEGACWGVIVLRTFLGGDCPP